MLVCNNINSLYVLHRDGSFLSILKMRFNNETIAEKTRMLPGSPHTSVSVTPKGKLILMFKDFPKYLTVCSDSGEVEVKAFLPGGVPLVFHAFGKGNGNFILLSSEDSVTRFTEITQTGDVVGNVTCSYVTQSNCVVDKYD